jgi:hypothetical protein
MVRIVDVGCQLRKFGHDNKMYGTVPFARIPCSSWFVIMMMRIKVFGSKGIEVILDFYSGV